MDAQDPSVSTPTPAPAQPKASPGFLDLAKASMQFLSRYWASYLKLGIILAIPILIFYAIATLYFIQSALGQDSFEAHAAPAIPSKPQVAEESTAPAADGTAPDAVAPVEAIPVPDPSALQADPVLGASETVTPDVAPPDEKRPDSIWDHPEGVGPSAVGTPTPNAGFFDNPVPISAPSVIGGGSIISTLMRNAILPLIFVLLIGLYQIIAILAFARLTIVIEKGEYSGAISVAKWSIHKLGSYLVLLLRILLYTYTWIPLAAMVAGFVAGAFQLVSAESFAMLQYVLGLLSLLTIIVVIMRIPRTVFAHFVLADRECGSKEALQHSVEISIGHWWQIVLYLIGIGFVSSLASGILSTVIGKINGIAGLLVSIVLSIAIAFYMVIFNFGLFRMLEAQFKPQK